MILSVLLVTFICMLPQPILAAGTGDDPTVQPYYPSEEEIAAAQEKEQEAIAYVQALERTRTLGSSKTLNVQYFKQENGYYCGPATTKQVLNFFNGSSLSQSQYARDLGTTTSGTVFPNIAGVLNKYQSKCNYVYREMASTEYANWRSFNIASIDWGNPVILDLSITSAEFPTYIGATTGHI